MPETTLQRPRWIGVPFRVVLMTAVMTLLAFAVSLLLSILGTVVYAVVKQAPPNMPYAYRYVAFPIAISVGVIVLALSLAMEIRHYRQRKALAAIEREG